MSVTHRETDAMPKPASPRGCFHWPSFAADAGWVAGSALAANALNYLFHFVLSRRLGPEGYGSLARLMAMMMMAGVAGSSPGTIAMQETARLWALHRDDSIRTFVRRMLRSATLVGAVFVGAMLILAVPLWYFLHIFDVSRCGLDRCGGHPSSRMHGASG